MADQLAQALAPDVRLAALGNVDAFTRLVERTSGMVCSIALAIARNVEDSEDIAQEVYIAAWQSLPKLNNHASFLPWLRQTARNRSRHAARTHGRATRSRVFQEGEIDAALASAPDPRPVALHGIIAEEERQALEEALATLADETREIVTLYYREGQSVRAVAELLELNEDVVKKRLQRARASLRSTLLDRAGDTLKKTAPGAALTTAVIAALAVGAPSGATAAGLTLTAAGAASKGTPVLKILGLSGGVLGGMLGGMVGGAGGFLMGARRDKRRIRNEQDRRRMGTLGIVGAVLAIAACLALVYGYRIWHTSLYLILWYVAYAGAVMVIAVIWRPRIMAATFRAEHAEDPVAAAARRKQERRGAWIGGTIGLVGGAIPIVVEILWRGWRW